MTTVQLLLEIYKTNPQRFQMLINDIEERAIVVGDRTETEITLLALKYALVLCLENQLREMTRQSYEWQFGKDWH